MVRAFPAELQWVPPDDRELVDLQIALTTVDGVETSLQEFDGKVIFLNFWATWCGPCRKEMPDIVKLQEQLGSEDFVVVAVSDDSQEDLKAYLEQTDFPFQFRRDEASELSQRLGVPMLPTTLILDRQKRIALAHVGAFAWNAPEVVEGVNGLLQE